MYGRDETGMDCVGLVFRVLNDLGMELEDNRNYSRNPEVEKINAILEQHTRPAQPGTMVTGRILKVRQFVFPMHMGILAVEGGKATMIHANVKLQAVVEQPYAMWKDLIIEHREVNGVR
jgi:cell wall-associated NlpC family hydrolase